jgi:hypothetical protein
LCRDINEELPLNAKAAADEFDYRLAPFSIRPMSSLRKFGTCFGWHGALIVTTAITLGILAAAARTVVPPKL